MNKNQELTLQKNEQEIFDGIVDFVKPNKTDIVLDVGSGIGGCAFLMAGNVKKVVGIEIRPERVAEAKAVAIKHGIDNVEFKVGIAQQLEFPDETFDTVTCRVALHHFFNPLQAISEINRVLKVGGKFEMCDPVFSEFAQAVWTPINRLRESDFNCFYTYFEILKMLNINGFEIISMKPFHFKRNLNKWVADGSQNIAERIRKIILELDEKVLKELRFTKDSEEEGWYWYYNCLEILSIKKIKPL